jgi:hypothetical protein
MWHLSGDARPFGFLARSHELNKSIVVGGGE